MRLSLKLCHIKGETNGVICDKPDERPSAVDEFHDPAHKEETRKAASKHTEKPEKLIVYKPNFNVRKHKCKRSPYDAGQEGDDPAAF